MTLSNLQDYANCLAKRYNIGTAQVRVHPHQKEYGATATKTGILVSKNWLQSLDARQDLKYQKFIEACPDSFALIEQFLSKKSPLKLKKLSILSEKNLHIITLGELQAVLSHEIGHIWHQHDAGVIYQTMTYATTIAGSALTCLTLALGFFKGSVFCENSRNPDCLMHVESTTKYVAAAIACATVTVGLHFLTKYFRNSKQNEKEADYFCNSKAGKAIEMKNLQKRMLVHQLLKKHAAQGIFEKLQNYASNFRETIGLRTHPSFAERFEMALTSIPNSLIQDNRSV